jgi:hypothetical protein
LDYRNLVHIDQVIASFGKMVIWHNNGRDIGYVLVKCLYNDPQTVPKSLVLRQGVGNRRNRVELDGATIYSELGSP